MINLSIETSTYSFGIMTIYGHADTGSEILWSDDGQTYYPNNVERDGPEYWISRPFSNPNFPVYVKAVERNSNDDIIYSSDVLQVIIVNNVGQREVTKIVNHIDEHAFAYDLERHPGETNESLKSAILDKTVNKHNSSKEGLINAISRELDLPIWRDFFWIKVRHNPATSSPYKAVSLSITTGGAWVSIAGERTVEKIVDGSYSHIFSKPLGIGDIKITIGEDGPIVDKDRYSIVPDDLGDGVWITKSLSEINNLHVSYPIRHEIYFRTLDDQGKLKRITVQDFQSWLSSTSTVNIDGEDLPLIIFGNNKFVNSSPSEAGNEPVDILYSVQEMYDINSPAEFKKIWTTDEYFKRVPTQNEKSLFYAESMLGFKILELTDEPFTIVGTPIGVDSLSDKEFLSIISNSDKSYQNTRLERYAMELRDVVHIGIGNTRLDYDSWGGDSPENIGPATLTNLYDPEFNKFSILINGDDGSDMVSMTANQRRHFMKELSR